jgi:hypothetical protein
MMKRDLWDAFMFTTGIALTLVIIALLGLIASQG